MEVAVIVKAEVQYSDRALELFGQAVQDRLNGLADVRSMHVQLLFELASPGEQDAANGLSSTCPPQAPAGR